MIPAEFEYVRADSVEGAVALLAEHGDEAKLLAGGMSLLPLMKLRLATPTVLVDVGRLRDLSYVRDAGDHVAIGALTRHRDLEVSELLASECAVLQEVAAQVGDPQVRHRGTLGGSAAHGDPAADLPSALLALDAVFVAGGPGGERTIAAAEYFEGFLETALAPDEILTEVRVPKSGPSGFSFKKFNRRAQDYAIVGAVTARLDGAARVALVNMGTTPIRATAVEEALVAGASIAEAALLAAEGTSPPADSNASAEFREHLARVLVRRALEDAAGVSTARGGVAVAVLAAGGGSRWGEDRPKPLALFAGRPLVSHALDAAIASGQEPVLLVVGSAADEVAGVAPAGVEIVRNDDWAEGIASSVGAAIGSLDGRESVGAVLVGLADEPLVGPEAYLRLAGAYSRGDHLAVATYGGRRGHPVLIAREHWDEARSLEGDEGARVLMRAHPVTEVPCDGTGEPDDVDTPEDLATLEARWRSQTRSA